MQRYTRRRLESLRQVPGGRRPLPETRIDPTQDIKKAIKKEGDETRQEAISSARPRYIPWYKSQDSSLPKQQHPANEGGF